MSIPGPNSSLIASSAGAAAGTALELPHDAVPGHAALPHFAVNSTGDAATAQAPDGNQMLAMASHFDDPWHGDIDGAQQRPVLSLLGYS